jgi:hypothetical protein
VGLGLLGRGEGLRRREKGEVREEYGEGGEGELRDWRRGGQVVLSIEDSKASLSR